MSGQPTPAETGRQDYLVVLGDACCVVTASSAAEAIYAELQSRQPAQHSMHAVALPLSEALAAPRGCG